jgi:chemotaxis protein methyltransferase CheR
MSIPVPSDIEREFACTEKDYTFFRELAFTHSGIQLTPAKHQMIYSRLARRVRDLGLPDLTSYAALLRDGDAGELRAFINAITTNLTHWFREAHHFDHLRDEVIPQLIAERNTTMALRIWSCAASTGEEPYSIAMSVRDALKDQPRWDVKILATDIDSDVLATCTTGVYDAERIRPVPAELRAGAFQRGSGRHAGQVRVRRDVASLLTFRQLNLLGPWPMKQRFDIVFCRNVVIYFDKPTQAKLFDRIADQLQPPGLLYLGHSESLYRVSDRFEPVGRSIYRKVG